MLKLVSSATKIVLLLLTLGAIYGMIKGTITPEQYNNYFMMVLAFYFGAKTKEDSIPPTP